MNDQFLERLRADWTAQETDIAGAVERIRRQRWRPWFALALEICGCAVALLTGALFAFLALEHEDQQALYLLSAGALLVLPPTFAVIHFLIRRRALPWADESPEALLRVGLRRAEISSRLNRVYGWGIAVLMAFLAVLWTAEWAGIFEARRFLIFYTCACAVASFCAWRWSRAATTKARRDREIYSQLLQSYDDS